MCAMDESSRGSSSMSRNEVLAIKEAFQKQQKLLQKLYSELEEEREASASAASEALSMILRVQGEKAAVKMEASQYKRMTEEKMHHIEKSLLMFKEMMYQKEMEINSLECQVQAYRYKMLSMGCNDLTGAERGSGEAGFSQQYEAELGDLRRNKSLPPPSVKLKDPYRATVDSEGPAFLVEEVSSPMTINREPSREFDVTDDIKSYWEQIKQLDERVEALAPVGDVDRGISTQLSASYQYLQSTIGTTSGVLDTGSRTCSIQSDGNEYLFYKPVMESTESINLDTYQAEEPANRLEIQTEDLEVAADSAGVQDIFEVPQIHERHKVSGSQKQKKKAHYSKSVLSKPSDRVAHCHLSVMSPSATSTQSETEVQQLRKRLEKLEGERMPVNQTYVPPRSEEEVKLLKEINEKLEKVKEINENLEKVQAELRTSKAKKYIHPRDDPLLISIMESMMMFTL